MEQPNSIFCKKQYFKPLMILSPRNIRMSEWWDGWAGAVMQKPLAIQKCDGRMDGPTNRPTRQGVESRVRD